jgi:hypothetical protein
VKAKNQWLVVAAACSAIMIGWWKQNYELLVLAELSWMFRRRDHQSVQA